MFSLRSLLKNDRKATAELQEKHMRILGYLQENYRSTSEDIQEKYGRSTGEVQEYYSKTLRGLQNSKKNHKITTEEL